MEHYVQAINMLIILNADGAWSNAELANSGLMTNYL